MSSPVEPWAAALELIAIATEASIVASKAFAEMIENLDDRVQKLEGHSQNTLCAPPAMLSSLREIEARLQKIGVAPLHSPKNRAAHES